MKLNTGFILIEEFDLEAITVAFRQGRLYLKTDDSAENAAKKRAAGIRDIMEYVARIDDCASAHTPRRHMIYGRTYCIPRNLATFSSTNVMPAVAAR